MRRFDLRARPSGQDELRSFIGSDPDEDEFYDIEDPEAGPPPIVPPATPPPVSASTASTYSSLFGNAVVSRIDTQNAARLLNERERQLTSEAVCVRCNSVFIELDSIGTLQCAMHPCTKWSQLLIRPEWWPLPRMWNSDNDPYPCCGRLYPWGLTACQMGFFGGDARPPLRINGCVPVDHASMRELQANAENPEVRIPYEMLTRRYKSNGVALFRERMKGPFGDTGNTFILTKKLYAV